MVPLSRVEIVLPSSRCEIHYVEPEKITEDQRVILARDVAKKIEDEWNIPDRLKSISSGRPKRLITPNKKIFVS